MDEELIYTKAHKSKIFGSIEDIFYDLFKKSDKETKANLSTFEWILYVGSLIYVLVMPFLYSRLTTENFLTPKEYFTRIFLGILGGLFCVGLFGSGLFKKNVALSRTSLDFPLVVFLGFCVMSVIWNYNGISAIRDLRCVLVIMLIFPIVINVYRSRWQVEILLWVVLFTGLATATIGVMETYNWYFKFDSIAPWIHYVKDDVLAKNYDVNGYYLPLFPQLASPDYYMGSVVSTFGNRNYLGTFAMFVAFVPLAFIFYYKNYIMKAISLSLFGWLLYGLYITRCRAALIGFAIGVIYMIVMAFINNRSLKKAVTYGIFVWIAVVIFLVAGLVISNYTIRSESMWDKIKLTFTLNRLKSNTYERMWVWYANNKAFSEKFRTLLIGQGFGSFKHFFPLKEAEVFSDRNKSTFTAVTFRQAHNDWLQIFSELGIVGMILFLYLVKRFYASIQNSLRFDIFYLDNDLNGDHILIIALGGAMVAQLFAALPDFPFHRIETAVFAVLFLSLVPVLTETNFFKSPLKRIPIQGLKQPLCIFLSITAFLGAFLNYVHEMRCWNADIKVRESEMLMNYKNNDIFGMLKARKILLEAISQDPLPGDPYSKLSAWYEQASTEQFRKGIKQVIDYTNSNMNNREFISQMINFGLISRYNNNSVNDFLNDLSNLYEDLKLDNSYKLSLDYSDKAWKNINFNARSTYHSITFRKMHLYYHVAHNLPMAYSEALKGIDRTAGEARYIYYFYGGKIATELISRPDLARGMNIQELETNAEKFLKRLTNVDKFDVQANASLAIFYAQKSNWSEAINCASVVCKTVPNDLSMLNILGIGYNQTANYSAAIQILTKAIELNPANPHLHKEIGIAYKNMHNYPEAKNHFERCAASTNCPEDVRAYALKELESIKKLQEFNNLYEH